jgi:tetratricopeptide (TPR) repeat protein
MKFAGNPLLSATAPAVFLFSLFFAVPIQTLAEQGQQADSASVVKIRSLAANQHEIVMLLIQKKEFDQAAAEAGKIFDMNWPANMEPVLLTELQILSKKFKDEGHPAVALRVLDSNLKAFKSKSSEIWIWKEKGYLYKSMNQNDKAYECFRKAQLLEEGK